MTKRPFSGEVAARSEVDRCTQAIVLDAVESCAVDKRIQLDGTTVEDGRRAEVLSVV